MVKKASESSFLPLLCLRPLAAIPFVSFPASFSSSCSLPWGFYIELLFLDPTIVGWQGFCLNSVCGFCNSGTSAKGCVGGMDVDGMTVMQILPFAVVPEQLFCRHCMNE